LHKYVTELAAAETVWKIISKLWTTLQYMIWSESNNNKTHHVITIFYHVTLIKFIGLTRVITNIKINYSWTHCTVAWPNHTCSSDVQVFTLLQSMSGTFPVTDGTQSTFHLSLLFNLICWS
jgi:hypothetical protein